MAQDTAASSIAAEQKQAANLFELSCSVTQITYSTSSFAGPPQLSYSGAHGAHSFSGEEIDTQSTALGTEVTVTLEAIPDLHTMTLTVVLPEVHTHRGEEQDVSGLAVFTTNHTTIAGPSPVQRSYEVISLDGVANLVDF